VVDSEILLPEILVGFSVLRQGAAALNRKRRFSLMSAEADVDRTVCFSSSGWKMAGMERIESNVFASN
jgi:hypothetical protein